MDPSFWGRSAWLYLHTLTFNYPTSPTPDDKSRMYNYFKQLPLFLPCPSCAKSFEIYFNYIPITEYLDDVYGLTFWLYTMHFLVNTKLKKSNSTFLSVVKTYLSHKTQCTIIPDPSKDSSKCSANKTKPSSDIYLNFKNIAEQKYMEKTKSYTSKLLSDYPTLQ
jgi:hypothetical protein